MATSPEFIEFVCEQLRGDWDVRSRKMFGEYMVYVNDKPVLLVCDGTVFVKQLPCVQELLAGAATASPYEGAKPHYILDIENTELAHSVVTCLEQAVPVPKPRKKKPKA